MAKISRKIRALGTDVDALDLEQATQIVVDWLANGHERNNNPVPCRFVVTPNLDHAVMLRSNSDLKAAYSAASLILADGMPLIWASRLFRRALPERVAGSDLVPQVLQKAKEGTRVFLLGASEQSSKKAFEQIKERFAHLDLVGRLSPPFGFEHSAEWSETITNQIRQSEAQLIVLGFGAPKQELWIAKHAQQLPGTVALCAGATIDFLGGTVSRAPRWMQQSGLEWGHRLLSNPSRLGRRYAKDALYLPLLLAEDAVAAVRHREKKTSSGQ